MVGLSSLLPYTGRSRHWKVFSVLDIATDYSMAAVMGLITRIEAFMEMIS
jgi:benzoyl-CoA reductase/2-hydroxyglutaryl-CoA dehydratase subunit BcrC/BadD/HgdB